MKRFIDLRKADTGYRFAWYCTVVSEFEEFNREQAWNTWEEFARDYENAMGYLLKYDPESFQLQRYKGLCPKWVFKLENLK